MSDHPAVRPRPRLAFWLSVILPGLGQVYSGAPLRGALFLALSGLGVFMVIDGFRWDYVRPPRENLIYCAIGIALAGGCWPASAIHARRHAARLSAWPLGYRIWPRLLASRAVQRAWRVAPAEIAMAGLFAILMAVFLVLRDVPGWIRQIPRYWFLYEAFGALYLAAVHGLLAALMGRGAARLRAGLIRKRSVGFFALSLLISGLLWALGVPADALLIGFLLALPSCWYTLLRRSGEVALVHLQRFGVCLGVGVASLFVFALLVNLWGLVFPQPEYEMRFRRDEAFWDICMGLIYYPLRAVFETWLEGQPREDQGAAA